MTSGDGWPTVPRNRRRERRPTRVSRAAQVIALEYSAEIAPTRGTSSGGEITLLPGQSPAEESATLAHGLAHEMMHRDEHRSSTMKRIRETEAKAAAFVVRSTIDLETGSAVQDYIGLYGGDAKLLGESVEYVQRTGTQVLTATGANASSALLRKSFP